MSVEYIKVGWHISVIATVQASVLDSEGSYGINTQVEKSKKMTTINFMGYDLNKLF